MQELNNNNPIKVEVSKEQKQEWKLIHRFQPRIDGGTVFEYDPETKEIVPATFIESDVFTVGMPIVKKLSTSPGRIYVEALHKKSALKRVLRGDYILKT